MMTKKSLDQNVDVGVPPRWTFPEDEARLPWLSLLLEAYAVIDRGISIAISREKRKHARRPACAEQCAVCCRTNTDIPVYPLELAGITWYAIEKAAPPVRTALLQQLSSHPAKPPCPFLSGGVCTIYPVRPIACRQYIVFGRPCTDGEDPYHARRGDVLTPIPEFMDQAVSIMLPFYGITEERKKIHAIKNRFIHSAVQNIFSCNWKTLYAKMVAFDSLRMSGPPAEALKG